VLSPTRLGAGAGRSQKGKNISTGGSASGYQSKTGK